MPFIRIGLLSNNNNDALPRRDIAHCCTNCESILVYFGTPKDTDKDWNATNTLQFNWQANCLQLFVPTNGTESCWGYKIVQSLASRISTRVDPPFPIPASFSLAKLCRVCDACLECLSSACAMLKNRACKSPKCNLKLQQTQESVVQIKVEQSAHSAHSQEVAEVPEGKQRGCQWYRPTPSPIYLSLPTLSPIYLSA